MGEKEKKKGKNGFIIVIITILVIIAGAFGGYYVYQKVEFEKPIEQDWGQSYYVFIKENIEQPEDIENASENLFDKKDAKIEFCDVENVEKPIMIYTYTDGDKDFTNIFHINPVNEEVLSIVSTEPSTVEYLYDVENKKYDWYIHKENNNDVDSYTVLSEQIDYEIASENIQNLEVALEHLVIPIEYTFQKDEKTSVTTIDGDEISISKFDEKFIKTDVVEENLVDFDVNISEKEMKDSISSIVSDFKTLENLVTDEDIEEVEKKEIEINNKKQEMEQAEEARKQKEEEEARLAEEKRKQEELEKGLIVGSHRLKYGTYKLNIDVTGLYGTITLEPDGKCHINSNCEIDSISNIVFNSDTTYSVELNVWLYGEPGNLSDCIAFNINGEKAYFDVYKDNTFSDDWHGYNYVGE